MQQREVVQLTCRCLVYSPPSPAVGTQDGHVCAVWLVTAPHSTEEGSSCGRELGRASLRRPRVGCRDGADVLSGKRCGVQRVPLTSLFVC